MINIFTTDYTSEKIIKKIKSGEWNDILTKLCNSKDDSIFLDHTFFKHFASKETYPILTNYILNHINNILLTHNSFVVHVNMKNLTLLEIDKHMGFLQSFSLFLKTTYENKMAKCYIYNAPFIISNVINMISLFVDAETLKKIEIVDKHIK